MAITKIHAIKSTLSKAILYIENPDKTAGQALVSGYNTEPQTASFDFAITAAMAHKAKSFQNKRSGNLAYHLIQSFSPEDAVTPELAHELGRKLAMEFTEGKFEFVVATHVDKDSIHNHIIGTSESSLALRVANVERRAGIANAQELGKLLGSMADNGLHSAADFDKQISAYQREEMKLRNEIAELRSKSKIYAATAHNLQACRTYKSVWLEYTSKPLAQKDTFYKKNEAALQTYCRAASQLDKMGISLGTEPEKVRQLVTETESRIADLIAELEIVRKTNQTIQEDKEKVEQIQSG